MVAIRQPKQYPTEKDRAEVKAMESIIILGMIMQVEIGQTKKEMLANLEKKNQVFKDAKRFTTVIRLASERTRELIEELIADAPAKIKQEIPPRLSRK